MRDEENYKGGHEGKFFKFFVQVDKKVSLGSGVDFLRTAIASAGRGYLVVAVG